MFTDTHAHLNDTAFDSDRGEVIARAGSVDVSSIVEIACAPAEWLPAVQLASAFPGLIRCAFGIHPVCVTDFTLAAMAELETILFQPCAVAVGEMGLDYWWEPDRKEAQLALLETQLELCVRRHKPAVFHVPRPQWQGPSPERLL